MARRHVANDRGNCGRNAEYWLGSGEAGEEGQEGKEGSGEFLETFLASLTLVAFLTSGLLFRLLHGLDIDDNRLVDKTLGVFAFGAFLF